MILAEPARLLVDIIFVHGLGSLLGTWSYCDDPWPKIWLPKASGMENALIMPYGYNADWSVLHNTSVLKIMDFGRGLLNVLSSSLLGIGSVNFSLFTELVQC